MFELFFIVATTLIVGGLVAANLRPVEMPYAGRAGQPEARTASSTG